jgi:hypothetical protein
VAFESTVWMQILRVARLEEPMLDSGWVTAMVASTPIGLPLLQPRDVIDPHLLLGYVVACEV